MRFLYDALGKIDPAIKPDRANGERVYAKQCAVCHGTEGEGLKSAKGGIVDTAIIAGTMAVKRTHELVPFCHPLPIDGCRLSVDWDGDATLRIDCHVRTVHRTGVEMEALTGATVAALTVYDMCKALSHAIVLGPAKLVGKRGGKRDVGSIAGGVR